MVAARYTHPHIDVECRLPLGRPVMTLAAASTTNGQAVPVIIREYEPGDLDQCRRLYAQLVEHHREIYDDPGIGGDDPGAGFDDYLATPERVMTWVATEGGSLIGMTGLFWENDESTIEPVIVDRGHRTRGVGRHSWG